MRAEGSTLHVLAPKAKVRPLRPAKYRMPSCPTCGGRLRSLTVVKRWCGTCGKGVAV